MDEAQAVRTEERGGALVVTLARPPVNVLDLATIAAIHAVLSPLRERRELRAVIFRSSLDGTFSAGVDVADHVPERAPAMLDAVHGLFRLVDALPQVAVAAVDGRCLGGACELVALCDAAFATPRSSFGFPEIDVGCFPPAAAALLPGLVGRAATELILTGTRIAAAEAERIGLITRVVADADAAAEAFVERLATKSAAVLAIARRALREAGRAGFASGLARAEALYRADLLASEDAAEGVRAFLEKRAPRWRDR